MSLKGQSENGKERLANSPGRLVGSSFGGRRWGRVGKGEAGRPLGPRSLSSGYFESFSFSLSSLSRLHQPAQTPMLRLTGLPSLSLVQLGPGRALGTDLSTALLPPATSLWNLKWKIHITPYKCQLSAVHPGRV